MAQRRHSRSRARGSVAASPHIIVADLEATVSAIAQRIASQPPIAVPFAKAAIDAPTLEGSYRLAAEGTAACLRSDDFRETRLAAREKRPPVDRGT